jgi:hypothetical protein
MITAVCFFVVNGERMSRTEARSEDASSKLSRTKSSKVVSALSVGVIQYM